ncbi:MAG: thioredoxin family protein [Helicobacter sp.]|uniref:thioredoxin family protein n=1 Tax=Helicobacter sp. TaxID=218 RepID=UPI0025C4B229|nr:thioredoxin family protein [Helicobacter sp.]MCH5313541.1 thioredoxin family protein [Helicobacter sp.]
MIEHLSAIEFDEKIKNGCVVVDFSAPWCPDCRHIDPMLESLMTEFTQVRFYKVSFDTELSLKDKFNIRKIPTLIFYKDGKEVGERLIEPRSIDAIKNAINAFL